MDLQPLFSMIFKWPLPNFSLGEGEPGKARSGTGDWRGFNVVSHWLDAPQCTEAGARYPSLGGEGGRTSAQQAMPPSLLQALRKVVQS